MSIYDRMRALGMSGLDTPNCIALTVGDFHDNHLFHNKDRCMHRIIAYKEHKNDIAHLLGMTAIADAILAARCEDQ